MGSLFSTLALYLSYPFVRYALIAGILIAFCASLLGVTLVLKHFALIGDGLSHVAFGTLSIATVFSLTNKMLLILPVTICAAILLLRRGQRSTIQGDAAIAMLSTGAMAMGYLLLNLFPPSANFTGDVCSTLFGSTAILTLSPFDVWLCIGLSLLVILVYLLFYHKLFAITLDEDFARSAGLKADRYNLLVAIITAFVIVLAMNLVGSLLISALIVFPALSALQVFKSFRGVILCATLLSVCTASLGILVAIIASTPVGSTIVAIEILAFCLFFCIGRIQGRWCP